MILTLTDKPPLLLQDLQRSHESMTWLHSMGYPRNVAAWSWTISTLKHDIDLTVRTIQQMGLLLLIGGVYLQLDRARS